MESGRRPMGAASLFVASWERVSESIFARYTNASPDGRNVRRARSPHAVVLLRGSDYARSLTFTRRGLEVLAERKPAHDFLSGEGEA